ncbi:MAG: hypothetical protein AAB394_00750 [Patescibacteria group bacterium]
MLNKKILTVLVIVLLVIIVIVARYIFENKETVPQSYQSSDSFDTTKENLTNNSNLSINKIPKYIGRPLDEVIFGKGFTNPGDDIVEKKRGDLKVLAAVLNASPMGNAGVDDWIAVGVIKKFFNDYEGVRDVWEYAGVLYPDNALSFANLGNLYAFYLHNNVKAELNFKKAIKNDPYQPSYYLGFADFYKNVYTEKKAEAPKILLDGIKVIKDVNLVLSLATYYRDTGDKANALKYYEEILKMEPNAAGIQDEINRSR